MAVNVEAIKNQIDALINQTKALEQEQSQKLFSQGLAQIISTAILSSQVIIANGAIITVGSATTQTNINPVIGSLQ